MPVFNRGTQEWLNRAALFFADKGFERNHQGKRQWEKPDHEHYKWDEIIEDQASAKTVHKIHGLAGCVVCDKREQRHQHKHRNENAPVTELVSELALRYHPNGRKFSSHIPSLAHLPSS